MKIATIITLTIAILGLTLVWWGTEATIGATGRMHEGYVKADSGVTSRDWSATAQGVDTIHWEFKNLPIYQGVLSLGLIVALPFSIISLVLCILAYRKKPNKALHATAAAPGS
jgi:hypothetical protein